MVIAMSPEIVLYGFFAFIICVTLAWEIMMRFDSEVGAEHQKDSSTGYRPIISGLFLPVVLTVIFALAVIEHGFVKAAELVLSACFGIFIHISVYYAVLILLMPLLRKVISSRACAALWMIPNYLYFTYSMKASEPLAVLYAPKNLVWAMFGIWLSGFVFVMLWKLISHLAFRRRILKNAAPVTDTGTIEVWNDELGRSGIKKPRFKLVVSSQVKTPLTVGIINRAIRVVLPNRVYSRGELEMIFRHELVHIGRQDSHAKFFLVFCTAMCWFNPLMYIAVRKSADDTELSCDETVLLDSDDEARRRYAQLILSTAGDERGFTTCLSASASALRYRLRNIVKPRKRGSGALVAGIMMFVLFMTSGYAALAYDSGTGAENIFDSRDIEMYTLESVSVYRDYSDYECSDEKALSEYLAGLEMYSITGEYSFSGSECELVLIYSAPEGKLGVVLYDRTVKITPLYDGDQETYHLRDGIDWEYIDSLLQ